mmetsp:Transcript_31962/g.48305  ORF Transcript_31962/g.48305 Transcript_31962/m.48305 type:complete len:262 (+) Transcript_31962:107-892(+)|eukprot:CAMPEP_0178921252 /NCGR_PEP_ID=MMETSP0786-20121207/15460_1 /TAXON_ID=186022 /ORGANISM="Thalassionema frauenfeldii, Strain CCMP 1798" /LENGTH=261 /DNA_ID=CAMNT_0020595415 /DNA_START=129 /DNA_END=914 /DNA_ORIENTATION=+
MAKTDAAGKVTSCHEAFLASMTFASGENKRLCNCDKCNLIPTDIREAISRHKRQKMMTEPLVRSQDRVLVQREECITVWRWTIPLNAEPLIDFGNHHSIIFVAHLPQNVEILAIGKGVIGSAEETGGRTKIDWKNGKAYLMPANGGKALGWVQTEQRKGTKSRQESKNFQPMILYNIKIPLSEGKIHDIVSEGGLTSDKNWVTTLFRILDQAIQSQLPVLNGGEKRNDKFSTQMHQGIELIEVHSSTIADVIKLLEGSKKL